MSLLNTLESAILTDTWILFCRNNLTAWHGGDALVLAVAQQNNNTIVVVNSVGPLILEPWIDHPNVTAVCIHFYLRVLPLNRL